jgi:methyl-accepting chemotaxis protein
MGVARGSPGAGRGAAARRLDQDMFGIATAQAQALGPAPDVSSWQIFLADPSFLVMNLVVIVVFAIVVLTIRNRYARFYRLQREALEHRKSADARVLARGESTEQLIERQYGVINTHNAQLLARTEGTEQMIARQYEAVNAFNQQIVARAEDALRISTETLAQINTMNQSLARIADRLDRLAGPTI